VKILEPTYKFTVVGTLPIQASRLSGNVLYFYLGGARFEFLPGHWLS